MTVGEGFALQGISANDEVGKVVSSLGDINGDGMSDFIVSVGENWLYIFLGSEKIFNRTAVSTTDLYKQGGFRINGTNFTDVALSGVGDVNDDGFDDFLIGAPHFLAPQGRRGEAYLIFGRSDIGTEMDVLDVGSLDGYSGLTVRSETSFPLMFGMRVGGAGDVNGDGVVDMIITASAWGEGLTANVYVVYGSSSLGRSDDATTSVKVLEVVFLVSDLAGYLITGTDIGHYCSKLGNLNGDDFADIVMGSLSRAVVIYGTDSERTLIDANALLAQDGYYLFTPPSEYQDAAGSTGRISTVAGGCDVNGDGYDDILVGDSSFDEQAGVTYVVYGQPASSAAEFDAAAQVVIAEYGDDDGFRVYGEYETGESGSFVSCVDDADGDGVDDFIIGAPGVNGSTGEAYVIYVKASFEGVSEIRVMDGSRAFRVLGTTPGDRCGAGAIGVGDLDGNGNNDILVSASFVTGLGEWGGEALHRAGEVYVVSVTPKDFPPEPTVSTMEQSIFEEPVTPEVVKGKIEGFFGSYVAYFVGLYMLMLLADKLGLFREKSKILTESAFMHYASKSDTGALHLRNSEQTSAPADEDVMEKESRATWGTKNFAAFNAEFYQYLELSNVLHKFS